MGRTGARYGRIWGGVCAAALALLLGVPATAAITLEDIDGYTPTMFSSTRVTFCKLDWESYHKEPWLAPMMRVRVKRDCRKGNTRVLSLAEVEEVMKMDGVSFLPPTAFVFHVARCGSTLMANAMAASTKGSRTYSESQALMSVIKPSASFDDQVKALQMAVKLMGIVTPSLKYQTHLFFKHQSVNTARLKLFTAAFPDVPWALIIRRPDEILSSMFRMRSTARNAPCLRYRRRPYESLRELAEEHKLDLVRADPRVVCAAHEGALMISGLAAVQAANGKAIVVDYEQLLDHSFPAAIISQHFGVELTKNDVDVVKATAEQYSKGSFNRAHLYKDDSSKKQQWAKREHVQNAVATYATPSYDKLHDMLFKPEAK